MRAHLVFSCLVCLLLSLLLFAATGTAAGTRAELSGDFLMQPSDSPNDAQSPEDDLATNSPPADDSTEPPSDPDSEPEVELPEPIIVLPPPLPLSDGVFAALEIDPEPYWFSAEADATTSIAWADVDLDGDLDVAVGNQFSENEGGISIYLNDGGQLPRKASWSTAAIKNVTDLVWGDMDADGDLDLAAAALEEFFGEAVTSGAVLRNDLLDGDQLRMEVAWEGPIGGASSVVWGDADGDSDLDLALGYRDTEGFDRTQIYLNNGHAISTTVGWESPIHGQIMDLAWGDIDDDGDLDLAAGVDGANVVYENRIDEAGFLELKETWRSDDAAQTSSVAWIDIDEDGQLDLSAGNLVSAPFELANQDAGFDLFSASAFDFGSNLVIYHNGDAGLSTLPFWESFRIERTTAIEWGDADADGDFDLLVANDFWPGGYGATEVYVNDGIDEAGIPILYSTWSSIPNDNSHDATFADPDNDGDLDILVGNYDYNLMYENRTGSISPVADWRSDEVGYFNAVAAGDYDRDGDLDLAIISSESAGVIVYRNDGVDGLGRPILVESWRDERPDSATSAWDLAWGDVDGDGDLDLAVAGGNGNVNNDPGALDRVYANDGSDTSGNLFMSQCWGVEHEELSTDVAWGDVDGDGDLDLAFGSWWGKPRLFLNLGGALSEEPSWEGNSQWATNLAWGDVDGDGDLDLATGVYQEANQLYRNDLGRLTEEPVWQSADTDATEGLAWGDVDNDGDLDLVAANQSLPAKLYRNDHGRLTEDAVWEAADVGGAQDAVWGDVDGDGDLDLLLADQSSSISLYQNRHGELDARRTWRSFEPAAASGIAAGDFNGDGLLDVVAVNTVEVEEQFAPLPVNIHLGRRPVNGHPGDVTGVAIAMDRSPAQFFALSEIQEDGTIPFQFTLNMPGKMAPRAIETFYSPGAPVGNGQRWLPAASAGEMDPSAIVADGSPNRFLWDVYDSGFFGRSDNVVVRLVAHPSYLPQPNSTPGPFQRVTVASETLPMRVRGNQLRVVDEAGQPVEGAMVYRLKRQAAVAEPVGPEGTLTGYRTDAEGYLQGFGDLRRTDELVAIWPAQRITTPYYATVYHLSAPPTENGLDFDSAQVDGVQNLTVSAGNSLVLFDLDLSLAWDARNDTEFLEKLENAIQQASSVLYDVTDGQVALGQVRVHQNKEMWPDAHVVLYAANNIHPRATMGGVVNDWVSDTMVDGRTIDDAYVPGQIRMGPLWDPFNQSQAELSVDWWRALAHELGHFLLFLPDNYLGLDNGTLRVTNCVGSLMTNAYDDKRYDEFLTEEQWVGDCLDTVASRLLTGRTDWETITTFLPMIQAPDADGATANSGPESLPLDVTDICFVEPGVDGRGDCLPLGQSRRRSHAFTARPYDIRDAGNNLTLVKQGQTYLYKTDLVRTDSTIERQVVDIIPLGSTGNGRDVVMVRGAERKDRVCIFDTQSSPPRVGCEAVSGDSPSVQIFEAADWEPAIVVRPIITRTPVAIASEGITSTVAISNIVPVSDSEVSEFRLAVTVTLPVSVASGQLMAQVIPAYGIETVYDAAAAGDDTNIEESLVDRVRLTLAREGDGAGKPWVFTGEVEPQFVAAEGFLRVWEPGQPTHEAVTQYFLSEGWDARARGTDPTNDRDGSARARGTDPTNERDGNARARGTDPTNSREGGARARGTDPTNSRDGGARARGTDPTNQRAWSGNRRTLEAPVASGDGRVTIFNLEDIFAPTGVVSLQTLPTVPSLSPWLTPVGKVYRFESTREFPATIAFHYLQREVPLGFEEMLRIYYQPDGEGERWRPLDTQLDTRENLASARMADSVAGTYALIATIELPALHPGWNLLAYTIPQTRTVESALMSIDGAYTVITGYDLEDDKAWRVYDPSIAQVEPALAEQLNDLEHLTFGRSYLIHATRPITPYLAVTDLPETRYLAGEQQVRSVTPLQTFARESSGPVQTDLLVSPARFFGPITGAVPWVNSEMLTITAIMEDGIVCGQGTIFEVGEQQMYMAQVVSEAAKSGCGRTDRPVDFTINGAHVGQGLWRNERAIQLPLEIEE